MAGMSLLRSAAASLVCRVQPVQRGRSGLLSSVLPAAAVPVRFASLRNRLFVIKPSTYYDDRFMTLLRLYFFLAAVPSGILILLFNIFVGPSELIEIPEGYVPNHWEYYRHPITRFLVRHVYPDHQKNYEQTMSLIHVQHEKRSLKLCELAARYSMRHKGDGPRYQFETLNKFLIDNSPKAIPDE